MNPNLITREQAEAYYSKQSYPNWKPYCMKCDTMHRMEIRDYGWQCSKCRNKIDFNLMHLREDGVNSTEFVKESVNKAMREVRGNILDDKYKYLADTKIAVVKTLEELKEAGWISLYGNVEITLAYNAPKIEYMVSTIPTMKGNSK